MDAAAVPNEAECCGPSRALALLCSPVCIQRVHHDAFNQLSEQPDGWKRAGDEAGTAGAGCPWAMLMDEGTDGGARGTCVTPPSTWEQTRACRNRS